MHYPRNMKMAEYTKGQNGATIFHEWHQNGLCMYEETTAKGWSLG